MMDEDDRWHDKYVIYVVGRWAIDWCEKQASIGFFEFSEVEELVDTTDTGDILAGELWIYEGMTEDIPGSVAVARVLRRLRMICIGKE